jgi:hypothetical protein
VQAPHREGGEGNKIFPWVPEAAAETLPSRLALNLSTPIGGKLDSSILTFCVPRMALISYSNKNFSAVSIGEFDEPNDD